MTIPSPLTDAPAGAPSPQVGDPNPSFDSLLDSVASPAPNAATGDEPAPDPEPEQTTDDQQPEPEVDAAPPAVDPNAPPATEQQLEDGIKPWGNDYRVTKPRMDTFVAHKNFAQAIQRFAPTVEAAREHYERANDFMEMHYDFSDPEGLGRWMDYWQKENPANFAELARQLPGRVQSLNPQVHSELQSKFVATYWDKQYEAAESAQDAAKFHEIQKAQYAVEGTYRDKMGKPDPLATQRKELEARQAAMDKRDTQQRDSHWTNTAKSILTDKAKALQGEISNALKPVESKFSKDQLDAFWDRIANVVDRKMKEDFEWSRNHEIGFGAMKRATMDALKGGKRLELAPHVKAHVQEYLSYARPIIQETARALIGQATARQVQQNQQQHARSAAGQKPGANGNRPANVGVKPAIPAGASFDDLFEAIGQGKA